MKLRILVLIFLISASIKVNALWSNKCKEAETSTDKVIKLLQNANCTLIEKKLKLQESLRNLKTGLQEKVEIFRNLFRKGVTTGTGTGSDGLDYAIDVRMLKDDDDIIVAKVEEIEVTTTNIPQRTKRDDEIELEETTTEEEFHQITATQEGEEEETTVGVKPYSVLIAPTKCRPGQRLVGGRCRTLVFDD